MIFHPMAVNTNTRLRWEAIKNLPQCKNIRGKKVLDIGSGLGFFSLRFAESGAEVLAIDTDAQALEYLHNSYNIETRILDVEAEILPASGFDLIFLGEVLEHVKDYQKILSKSMEALLPAGVILLTTPANEGPLTNTTGKRLGHTEGDQRHQRDGFYLTELKEAIVRSGMSVIHHSFCIFFIAELFMQLTKKNYLKNKKAYNGQSDVLELMNNPGYKILCLVYPILLMIFNIEHYVSRLLGLKGHCHILIAKKEE